MKRRSLLLLPPCVGSLLPFGSVRAQSGRLNRPVQLVVPYAAGGTTDAVARRLAPALSQRVSQPVMVDNRPGAGGLAAAGAVARAAPDGHTLLAVDSNMFFIDDQAGTMGRREALEALDLLGVVAETPLIIAASPNQPIRSARDLVETLKQGNARLNISGGGTGLQSPAYRCYTLLQRMINARADYVPYRTAAAALQDTLAGSVHIFVGSLAIADEAIRTGRLMPLARLSSAVAPGFEALPTLDQFIPGFRFSVWTGIMSPRGAPQAIRDMLSSDIIAAAQAPAFREQIGSIGLVPLALGRSEAMQLVRLEIDLWLDRWCCRGGG